MTATSQPFGLKPINHFYGGEVRLQAVSGFIQSGYGTAIYEFSPIKIDPTTGYIIIGTTSGAILGSFAGCRYLPVGQSLYVNTRNWPAGGTYVAGTMTVFAYTDPNIEYLIQANGSVSQTAIGQQANFVNPGAGTTQGFSSAQISTTLASSGSAAQLRIVDIGDVPNNAWGDSYTILKVQIAQHQYVSAVNTLA